MSLKFPDELTINGTEWTYKPFRFNVNKINASKSEPSWKDVILSGSGLLTLINAKANGLNYVKLFGATEQRNLPSEYTQVKYLESSGTQYIDTGIILKSEATITTVGQGLEVTSGVGAFWGFLGTKNLPRWGWYIYQSKWLPTLNETTVTTSEADTNKHTFINNCYYDNNVLKQSSLLDGNSFTERNVDYVTTYTSNTLSTYLFARNNKGTAGNFLSCRIFNFEIIQDGVKVLSLIPCRRKSDSVLGMYDTVTGNFLTNAGTGSFTAGEDVTPGPDTPMDIYCNNGAIKYGFGRNLIDNTIDGQGTYATQSASTKNRIFKAFGNISTGKYKVTISEGYEFIVQYRNLSGDSGNIGTWNTSGEYDFDNSDYSYGIAIRFPDNSAITPEDFNGTLSLQIQGIYADGTQETVTVDTTGDTATAEMLLSVGDYKDVQSVTSGAITRNIGIKVLDGTENWLYRQASDGVTYMIYSENAVTNRRTITTGLCTHFNGSSQLVRGYGNMFWGVSSQRISFSIDGLSISSANDWKQWLATQYANGTPVIVVYPLAEPATESVTPQPLSIQQGTNTLTITQASIDNLEMEVSYKAGVSVTVTEVQNAQLSNNVEVTVQ